MFEALGRGLFVILALCVGWLVYMVGMMVNSYEGLASLILQPIMGAFTSAIFVSVALALGLVLRLRVLREHWCATWFWPSAVATASLATLLLGYPLGFRYVGVHPETGQAIEMLHPVPAIAGYLGLLFAVANWPTRRSEV